MNVTLLLLRLAWEVPLRPDLGARHRAKTKIPMERHMLTDTTCIMFWSQLTESTHQHVSE